MTTTAYPETGWYWHVHHDALMEWCTGYTERAAYIRATKPTSEQAVRFRLFRPVVGTLPEGLTRAGTTWARAQAKWARAEAKWQAVRHKTVAEAELDTEWTQAEVEQDAEWQKAAAERTRALAELRKAGAEFSLAAGLHRQECQDCPWDGKTIFP